jgi:calcium-dependent protein kinase
VSILRELDHPNIVKLYGVYQDDDIIYLSLELCEGGSLKSRLNKGALSAASVKGIAKQLFTALSYLHHHKIGHRDLKADNILFTSEGQVKVADFGLSRMMSCVKAYSQVGTPFYLAPEVIRGAFDCQCDMWSAGVVLYYTLTGGMPFDGDSMRSLLFKMERSKHLDMSHLPHDAQTFLRRLLDSDCSTRLTANDALRDPWLVT